MYGVIVSYNWFKKWEKTIEVDDDEISSTSYGRDGKFIIVGKTLEKINDESPYIVPELDPIGETIIANSIKEKLGVKKDLNFQYFFIEEKLK